MGKPSESNAKTVGKGWISHETGAARARSPAGRQRELPGCIRIGRHEVNDDKDSMLGEANFMYRIWTYACLNNAVKLMYKLVIAGYNGPYTSSHTA